MLKEITVPDIGTTGEAAVIEIAVKPGDSIQVDQTLITLESEKASMEIPSPEAGVIESLIVKLGDKVKTGAVILKLQTTAPASGSAPLPEKKAEAAKTEIPEKPLLEKPAETEKDIYASPAVRRLARELNINLETITGSGRKARIQKADLIAALKGSSNTSALPSAPIVDFTQFGETETQPLSKIKKLTAVNLHRNWVLAPHVTQHGEADITEMEAFRKAHKLTPLVFIMKAVVGVLKQFPQFNASLDADGENLILKKYYHLGIAVDTPDGLVVPVIRNVDQKNLLTLAQELTEISQKARNKQLLPKDMQGSCFTISSLGGIGGCAFTPIINLPDVAILGISKSQIKPIYQDGEFIPRLMLPLSLSYDHRVIDGAEGARFIVALSQYLSDTRLMLL